MLIRVFKSNQNLLIGLIVLLTVFLWLPSFFIDAETGFSNVISTGVQWLDVVIAIFLIAFQAVYLNIIVNEYKLVENNTHLTSLIFVLFNGCCWWLLNLNQVVIANTFILLAFHQLLRLDGVKNSFGLMFNVGFLVSLASLIYIPNCIYLILIWVGLIYLITPKWRDFVITLLGFAVPIIYFVSYHFVVGNLSEIKWSNYAIKIFDVPWSDVTLFMMVLFFMILGTSVLAMLKVIATLNRGALKTRKMLTVVLVMLVLGMGTLALNHLDYLATFVMITIPLSIIVANFFQGIKKTWLAELLFTCLIVSVILGYFL